MDNCVFCKIRDGVIKKELAYEDDDVMVFPDIAPLKPVHILVVPKKHVKEFIELSDDNVLSKLAEAIKQVIKNEKLDKNGYRVTVNGGGAQAVDHLHFHVLGPFEKAAKM